MFDPQVFEDDGLPGPAMCWSMVFGVVVVLAAVAVAAWWWWP